MPKVRQPPFQILQQFGDYQNVCCDGKKIEKSSNIRLREGIICNLPLRLPFCVDLCCYFVLAIEFAHIQTELPVTDLES